ncbi:MAG: anaerobic sulfatase maturase [Bacteroidota bacterium]
MAFYGRNYCKLMLIRKPLTTIVVKSNGSRCNLNCEYCFYLKKDLQYSDEQLMDDSCLEIFIRQLMEQSGTSFGIVWQGGEPSLTGATFYRKVIAWMQHYGQGKNKLISNLLQTNGYSLSNEMLDLMSEYSFLCGLSLDGPEEIHDAYRKTSTGKGSWNEVMKSWKKLQARNIATNILCCVTSASANRANDIYHFYKQNAMHWLQFIPVSEFNLLGKSAEFSLSAKDWGQFMCDIFDSWHYDYITNNQPPSIRFVENAFYAHLGLNAPECTFSEECGNYLVLEHNGDVFSCDYLVGNDTLLGNIHQQNLIDMLNSPQQISFGVAKKNHHEACQNCRWLNYCYGGCPKYRDPLTQKYSFCESWKTFLNYSEKRFIPIVANYKKNISFSKIETLDISGFFQ